MRLKSEKQCELDDQISLIKPHPKKKIKKKKKKEMPMTHSDKPCPCILRGQHLTGLLSPETYHHQFLSHNSECPSSTKEMTDAA